MSTVTKKDLIDRISVKAGLRRGAAKLAVHLFLQMIIDELAEGRRIEFRDFGVFEIKTRAARAAQNPKTLERVTVPSRRTVKFKPGRALKERLGIEPPGGGSGNGGGGRGPRGPDVDGDGSPGGVPRAPVDGSPVVFVKNAGARVPN